MNATFDRVRMVNRSQSTIVNLKYRAEDKQGGSILAFDRPVRIRRDGFRDDLTKQLLAQYVAKVWLEVELENGLVIHTRAVPQKAAGDVVGVDFALDDGPKGYSLSWRLYAADRFEDGGA